MSVADAFDLFRDDVSKRFGLGEVTRPQRERGRPFSVGVAVAPSPQCTMVEVTSAPVSIERTKRDIDRWERPWCSVGLLLEGECHFSQQGRSAIYRKMDYVLCDSAHPFRFDYDGPFRQLIVVFDREELLVRLPEAERQTGRRFDGSSGPGAVAAAMLTSMWSQAATLGIAAGPLARHALDVVALSLGGPRLLAETDVQAAMRAKILAFIDINLANRLLGPDMIAHHHGISRRYLYRLFEEGGDGVAGAIRRRRLEAVRALLEDPREESRAIGEIAFACGFNDLSHFGREFRRSFGSSPREHRARSRRDARGQLLGR